LTPKDDANLVAMDHFILDDVIVNFIIPVYKETDADWYSMNADSVLDFFWTFVSSLRRGYLSNGPNNPGFAAGYNLPGPV
jgi:hypothetical protein